MRKATSRRQSHRGAESRENRAVSNPGVRLLQLSAAAALLLTVATPATLAADLSQRRSEVSAQTQAQTAPNTQSPTRTPAPAQQPQGQQNQSPGASSTENVKVLDEIVAKVNNEIITLTDFNRELQSFRSQLADEIRDPQLLNQEIQKRRGMLLRMMIENKMMVQKAEEMGMTANMDVEVAATLEEIRKENGIPSMEVFDQLLRQRGSSLEQHRATIKQRMIVETLIRQMVYSKLTLLTPEIEAYYKENVQRFSEPAEVELAEILFLTEGKDKAQVRRQAEEVLARLKGGAAFEEEAKKNSEGPTASRGGNIGAFKKGSMAPGLEAVVFDMKAGEISNVIETDYGFQIVKLVNKKENQVKPLAEVRPQITNELYQKKAEPEVKEFLEDLRSQSYIYVAPDYKKEYDQAEQMQAAK